MTRPNRSTAGAADPVSRCRFYGDQFVLDTVSGNFYRVTPTAGLILRALLAGKTSAEVLNLVQQQFKIDRSRALRDVEMFTSELRSLGIIGPQGA